ncbi:MAG: hypothetical protein WAR78_02880 [Ferruginibacter sp.]
MAKKNKPAKKAAPKKVVAKKPAKKIVKKAAPKKSVKKIVKKAAPKKSVKKIVKKAAPKRSVKKIVKKAAPKKSIKKTINKIAHTALRSAKKQVVKKAVIKVVPPKAAVKPASPIRRKVTVPVQKTIPTVIPVATPIPTIPVIPSPDDLGGKAANIETDRHQMMVPGDGLDEAPLVTENPSTLFDRNAFNKATAKGDPHSNMQISSARKGSKQHSGKKPLWRK